MKRKLFASLFFTLLAVSLISAAGCTGNQYEGFDVPSREVAEIGSVYSLHQLNVTNSEGEACDVEISVQKDGEEVLVLGGKFEVSSFGEYVIKYTIRGTNISKECILTSRDTTAPVIRFNDLSAYYGINSEIDLSAVFAEDNSGEITALELTVTKGNESFPVPNNRIVVLEENGKYILKASAKDAAGNESASDYAFYVRGGNEMDFFEFEESIALGAYTPIETGQISLCADDKFVMEGNSSLKVPIPETSEVSWPRIQFNAFGINNISDKSSVSFWIYNDSKNTVLAMLNDCAADVGRFSLQPKAWTEIFISADNYATVFHNPSAGYDFSETDFHSMLLVFWQYPEYGAFDVYIDGFKANDTEDPGEIVLDGENLISSPPSEIALCDFHVQGTETEYEKSIRVFDADGNELDAVGERTFFFEEEGNYLIRYFAYDGKGNAWTAQQNISIAENISPNTLVVYDYEDGTVHSASNQAEISVSDERAYGGEKALKAQCNADWVGLIGYSGLDLSDERFTKISFYIYIAADEGTGWVTPFYDDLDPSSGKPQSVATNTWVKVEIEKSAYSGKTIAVNATNLTAFYIDNLSYEK